MGTISSGTMGTTWVEYSELGTYAEQLDTVERSSEASAAVVQISEGELVIETE